MSIDTAKTVQNVIGALNGLEVKGAANMEIVLGSINALNQVLEELTKPTEIEVKPDLEEDDGK